MRTPNGTITPRPINTHHFISGRFFWLLLSLIVFIIVAGEVPTNAESRWNAGWPLVAILIAASYSTRQSRARFVVSLSLNLVLLILAFAYAAWPLKAITCAGFALLLVSLFTTFLYTLDYVFRADPIGPDHILGAVCAYVLASMAFATIYTLQWIFDPHAFTGMGLGTEVRPWRELFYFSLTTLTTTRYGDITPAVPSTRSASMVEQLFGTFYMAVIFARLVGLYVSHAVKSRKDDAADE